MTSDSLIVRPFQQSDRAAVLRLAPRLTEGVATWRDQDSVRRAVVEWVESSTREGARPLVLVAEYGEQIVGFASASTRKHWSGDLDGYLGELVVDTAAEGRGVGRALVRAVEEWAVASGLGRLTLDTGAANRPARAFYDRLGFVEEDVRLTRLLGSGSVR